jgi:glycosyltransferase involved in cell wall biosynthesis
MIKSMSKQRILIFAAYFHPHLGGYEKNIYALSERLAERGCEIDVVTCNTEGASVEEEVNGIRVHRLPSWNILANTYPIPKPTATTFKILFELSRKRFDLINTQTRFFSTSLLGLIFARIKRTPLVHTERGTRHSVLSNRLIELLSKVYDHTIGSLIVKSAKRNIGVSQAACDFLRHLGARNTIVIPNGIDTDVFKRVETNLTKSLGLNGVIVITFVGRLIYAKGVQDLISAFPMIKEAVPNIKLLIVGDGPYRCQLEKQAVGTGCDKDIKLLGSKNQDQIIEVLSVTDIFVNPSYSEGLPTSVMEAAAIGVPIVATDVGGTREIIENGKTGSLIKAGEPRQIAEAVSLLAGNRQSAQENLAEKLGKAARLKIVNHYSWENVVRKTTQVYREIL